MNTNKQLKQWLMQVIAEDIGDGDHTSLATIPSTAKGKAQLLIKENGIIAGIDISLQLFALIDKTLKVQVFINDGSPIKKGDIALVVSGNVRSILQAERPILNIIQHMSGIATNTNSYVQQLKDLKTKVLDTRKTTPGMRIIEKMAVRIGGGGNHRFGLYDMILIKDNHIDFAGGIEKAINNTCQYLKTTKKKLPIEIEARSIDEVRKILTVGKINRILLDNFSINDTKKAVKLIAQRYEVESSGGITLKNIRQYAECGVDFISVGELTHHIKSLDMSLKAVF